MMSLGGNRTYWFARWAVAFALCAVLSAGSPVYAARIVKGVVAEGACAIRGMTDVQASNFALQNARLRAIENAVGVRLASVTTVRNNSEVREIVQSYARGFIIREEVEWLPMGQFQESPGRRPIPEYRVRIKVDVSVPERIGPPLGLKAGLNNTVFRKGEKAKIEVMASRDVRIAVFNLTANDEVYMLFPHHLEADTLVSSGGKVIFPSVNSRFELVMQPLPGHDRDVEAMLVIAVLKEDEHNFLHLFSSGGSSMKFAEFFARYAEIAEHAEEAILPYEVTGSTQK